MNSWDKVWLAADFVTDVTDGWLVGDGVWLFFFSPLTVMYQAGIVPDRAGIVPDRAGIVPNREKRLTGFLTANPSATSASKSAAN